MPPTLAPALGARLCASTTRCVAPAGRAGDTGRMGHLDIGGIGYVLSDGRPLLDDVTFRVADGARVALVGPNGAGKTTLLRIVAGDEQPHAGSVGRSGGLGIMRQDIGRSTTTGRSATCSPRSRRPPSGTPRSSSRGRARDHGDRRRAAQMRYAQALVDWADVGGYEAEAGWDRVTDAVAVHPVRARPAPRGALPVRRRAEAAGPGGAAARPRRGAAARRARQRARRADQAVARGQLRGVEQDRAVRQPRPRDARQRRRRRWPPSSPASWGRRSGCTAAASAPTTRPARTDARGSRSCCGAGRRSTPSSRSSCSPCKTKSAFNDGLASRYPAAQTRLRKFEEAGPPTLLAREQNVRSGCTAVGPPSARSSRRGSSSPG